MVEVIRYDEDTIGITIPERLGVLLRDDGGVVIYLSEGQFIDLLEEAQIFDEELRSGVMSTKVDG